MKLELQLAAALLRPVITPLTNDIPTETPQAASTASRKELRVRTDALISDGQMDLVQAVERSAEIMLSIGSILLRHDHDPHEGDLIEACIACIENGRAVMDKGLLLESESTTNCGAVMLELTVRGLLATLGVPYDRVLVEIHRARKAGEAPKVRELLESVGLVQPIPPEAANDSTQGDQQ